MAEVQDYSQEESNGAPKKVVICGAGVIGAATAYYLSLKGVGATVVERGDVACASSGACWQRHVLPRVTSHLDVDQQNLRQHWNQ